MVDERLVQILVTVAVVETCVEQQSDGQEGHDQLQTTRRGTQRGRAFDVEVQCERVDDGIDFEVNGQCQKDSCDPRSFVLLLLLGIVEHGENGDGDERFVAAARGDDR